MLAHSQHGCAFLCLHHQVCIIKHADAYSLSDGPIALPVDVLHELGVVHVATLQSTETIDTCIIYVQDKVT